MALVLVAHLLLATPSSGQFYRDSPASLLITPPPMTMDKIDPNCENFTHGNWRIQEFYTPNYPGEYLNNTDCVSYLEAPPGFRIQLDFRDKFILEKSEGCKYDYLEVRDGPFAYSPPIGRYCNAEFPPIIKSSGRFLWMRFKTDDLLQYGGFRAVYSYLKDHTQNDGAAVSKATSNTCRIPVKLSVDAADGVLSSDDIPYGDVNDPKYPKGHSMDCTWELYTESTHGINLRSTKLNLKNQKRCETNNVTIYERTTLESSIKEEYCRGNNRIVDMTSDSNRVFVRIYGSTLKSKPEVKMIYSMVRKGKCNKPEMRCGDVCLPRTLICNGVVNCKDRSDEKGCSRIRPSLGRKPGGEGGDDVDSDVIGATGADGADPDGNVDESADNSSVVPLHIIILGAVGGVIVTCVSITLCVMCRLRRRDREKRQELSRQKSSQRNALEMAVCSSSNTTQSLSRQNEAPAPRSGPGSDRHHYVTFSKMNSASPNSSKDGSHRYSLSDRGMPQTEGEAIPEQMTESGNYKRFLTMDITPDDMMDESIPPHQQGLYPPSPGGVMGMTNLDHRMADVYPPTYHSTQWHPNLKDDSMMYPYGSSSLTRPTPFLGLSKPFYNQPDSKYESKYLKALKTMENDSIKEHQTS